MAAVAVAVRDGARTALALHHGPLAEGVKAAIWEGSADDMAAYQRRLVAVLCVGHSNAASIVAPGGVEAAVSEADAPGRLAALLEAEAAAEAAKELAAEEARTAVSSGVTCRCGSRDVRVRTQQTRSADEVRSRQGRRRRLNMLKWARFMRMHRALPPSTPARSAVTCGAEDEYSR